MSQRTETANFGFEHRGFQSTGESFESETTSYKVGDVVRLIPGGSVPGMNYVEAYKMGNYIDGRVLAIGEFDSVVGKRKMTFIESPSYEKPVMFPSDELDKVDEISAENK